MRGDQELIEKLKKIKAFAFDVDGILTDGRIFYVEGSGWTRMFHTQDGHGIKTLLRTGHPVALISAADSLDMRKRAEHLEIQDVYLGSEKKIEGFTQFLSRHGLKADEVAFMGDDVLDLPLLELAGFSATVPHAIAAIKSSVHYVTQNPGGFGAVREVIEMYRRARPF